jgi:hypothetical protein
MPGNKRAIRSDLKKVDAHVIRPEEYDDAPELTDAQIADATVTIGIRPRGRPKSETRKAAISLRWTRMFWMHSNRPAKAGKRG